jgi:hypothetical protein
MAKAGRNQHMHGCPRKIGSAVLRRANHHDPVRPRHLPGGEPGGGPPPGRKFQQWIDWARPPGVLPRQPDRREILREHRAARQPRRDPGAVSLGRPIATSASSGGCSGS